MEYSCLNCCFSTLVDVLLIKHVGLFHKNDAHLKVNCVFNRCGAPFSKWKTFERHVARIHSENIAVLNANNVDAHGNVINIINNENEGNAFQIVNPTDYIQLHTAQFLINLRETYRTSQVALSNVTEGLKDTLGIFSKILLDEIRVHVDPATNLISLNDIEEICIQLTPSELLYSVHSQYLLDKLLVQKFNMILSEKFLLGTAPRWITTKTPPYLQLIDKKEYAISVPFLPSLKNLLRLSDVRNNIDNPLIQHGGKLQTSLHGSIYKNNEYFSNNRNSIAIILYGDELGVANPLGASSKKHKLQMFYWTIANIHPKHRSTRDLVQLLLIVKSTVLKRHGLNKILQPFISDIETLQRDGINVTVNGQELNYKGSLLFVAADTPAAAKMGGFKQSVAAHRPCRSCLATQDSWKLSFRETNFILRNEESHREHLEMITQPNTPNDVLNFWNRRYGVNEKSPLLNIPHFDVTECLPQDPMHVLIEGVGILVIKAILRFCIVTMGLFSVEDFNVQMSCFEFNHFKVNKPADISLEQITEDGKLRQSASQIFSLLHVIPFLILGYINNDDHIRRRILCHTRFLQILNICFAYEIEENILDILSRMIELFVIDYNDLYPNTIVPKFHFMVHIPRYIELFGPPRQFSCFRFEGAHNFFKSLVPVVRNFKNMPYTMAYRNQARISARLSSAFDLPDNKFLYHGDDIVFGEIVLVDNLPNAQLLYDTIPQIVHGNMQIMRTPKVQQHETIYERHSIILLECEPEFLPKFGEIQEIFVIANHIVIIFKNLQTLFYSEDLNAYCIDYTLDNLHGIKLLSNLIFPHPLPIFRSNANKFVLLLNHQCTEFYG